MLYTDLDELKAGFRTLTEDEEAIAINLLKEAAVIIDSYAPDASDEKKAVVSCRMVRRALGDGRTSGVPIGATQGSMSGLGYTQSWTIGTGGSVGELYIAKTDKKILGLGTKIGSKSPLEDLC